jgi:exodeoxyribonuclease-3
VATPGLARRAAAARVERAAEHALRWSDHAPVTVRYQ